MLSVAQFYQNADMILEPLTCSDLPAYNLPGPTILLFVTFDNRVGTGFPKLDPGNGFLQTGLPVPFLACRASSYSAALDTALPLPTLHAGYGNSTVSKTIAVINRLNCWDVEIKAAQV